MEYFSLLFLFTLFHDESSRTLHDIYPFGHFIAFVTCTSFSLYPLQTDQAQEGHLYNPMDS